MYPILLRTNNITIYSFGLFVILGILIGVIILYVLARKLDLKISNGKFFDYTIYVLFAGMIGARLFYIIFHITNFKNNFLQIITSWPAGLSFYGGLISGLFVMILLLRKNKDILKWLDIGLISTMYGLAIGMFGCFLNGSYYGKPMNLSFGVTYTKLESFAINVLNQKVHATQLYEMIVVLIIATFLLIFVVKQKNRLTAGITFFIGIIFYGIWKIINDYIFLYKPEMIGTIRVDSLIAIVSIICSIIGLIYLFVRKKNNLNREKTNG